MLPQGSIIPNDTLIAPITNALISVTKQIQGIGTCYPQPPDAPPEDNSVLFPCKGIDVDDEESTNGKLVLKVHFDIIHVFRRARLPDTLAAIYPYLPAWLTALTAWSNQTLGGLAQNLELSKVEIGNYTQANQVCLGITSSVTVKVVFNVNLQP